MHVRVSLAGVKRTFSLQDLFYRIIYNECLYETITTKVAFLYRWRIKTRLDLTAAVSVNMHEQA